MVLYGQVALGPPGSGKTTFCNGMQQYLQLINREAVVINLDPANEIPASSPPPPSSGGGGEHKDKPNKSEDDDDVEYKNCLPYNAIYDVCEDLVNLTTVMSQLNLGPNGGLVYCMEYIEHHIDHVISTLSQRLSSSSSPKTKKKINPNIYILIDLPGQVELYTHCTCVHRILYKLSQSLDMRLTAVNLVDAHACVDATKFISAALLSTTSMIRLELPAVNVLSKIDLMEGYTNGGSGGGGGEAGGGGAALPFNLDYFTECHELERLVDYLDTDPFDTSNNNNTTILEEEEMEQDEEYQKAIQQCKSTPFRKKHRKMHESLCEVIDDFGLLSFVPLNISDPVSVGRLVARVDKSNGYVFAAAAAQNKNSKEDEEDLADMFHCAVQLDQEWEYEAITDVQERYLGTFRDELPELTCRRRQQQQKQEHTFDDGNDVSKKEAKGEKTEKGGIN